MNVGDLGLGRLLALEDDPAILDLVCPDTGLLAWPTVRLDMFRYLIGDLLYETAPLSPSRRWQNSLRRVSAGLRAFVHNRLNPPRKSSVLLCSTGAGLIPRGGRAFNRHVDYFADSLRDDAWTIESVFEGIWPTLRRSNGRLGIEADHELALAVKARALRSPIHQRIARDLVEITADRARRQLGWELGDRRQASLIAIAARRLATYPLQERHFHRLIRQIQPRLMIVEEGCYGHMAVINAAARRLGVPVAEFQHGMVTRGHDAYNVAPRLARSQAYQLTQPSAFLAYGQWWTEQFNAPVERVVVGNPHRSETLRRWRPAASRTTVLVLGDGVETAAYLALCRRLEAVVRAPLRVLFRPHPLERTRIRNIAHAVAIDEAPDLYRTLSSTFAVIGEASTALFESVGMVPRILVWDTPKSRFYLGDHPFESFADPRELGDLLSLEPRGRNRGPHGDDVWASDWQSRFLAYVGSVVGGAKKAAVETADGSNSPLPNPSASRHPRNRPL